MNVLRDHKSAGFFYFFIIPLCGNAAFYMTNLTTILTFAHHILKSTVAGVHFSAYRQHIGRGLKTRVVGPLSLKFLAVYLSSYTLPRHSGIQVSR